MAAPGSFTCTNSAPVTITSVNSASAYGGYLYFASGSWLEIKGTNLADPADPRLTAASNPGQWTAADFNGSAAPTSLDGISVSINGKPAYVWYLSPAQINVQAPEDPTIGTVAITVTNCKATSSPFTSTRRGLAPGLLAPSSFNLGGKAVFGRHIQLGWRVRPEYRRRGGHQQPSGEAGRLDYRVRNRVWGCNSIDPARGHRRAEQFPEQLSHRCLRFNERGAIVRRSGGQFRWALRVLHHRAAWSCERGLSDQRGRKMGAALPQTMFLTIHN